MIDPRELDLYVASMHFQRFDHEIYDGNENNPALIECDCCGKPGRLTKLLAYGIETWACAKCRGDDEDDTNG